ncbi:MAG: methionine--tRNA ligase [Polyangia bacterium]
MSAVEPSRFYLTTPIYYASGPPHIGHAYTTIVGDALARYQRTRRGPGNAYYLTGTDEHGEKIERAAMAHSQTPQAFVDDIASQYRTAWQALDIKYDDFIRTSEPRHKEVVQRLWTKMRERGDIYLDRYEGLYCVSCENFYLEKDLLPGNLCPDHKRPVEKRSEEGYFFRLSKYQEPLLRLYDTVPDFISPPRRMNEVRTFVESGLRDLSVSRSSFSWGVPVPEDPRHIIYVWIDALTNYYSALQGDPRTAAFWGTQEQPLAVHLVGKEIIRFHAVYWPAVLMSAGLPVPRKILAHGWWTVDGEKMSKTLGNVIDPVALAGDLSASALRYFVLREIPLGEDGDFVYDALLQRYNSELANDLGNLLNRTLAMVERYCDGRARRWGETAEPGVRGAKLETQAHARLAQVEAAMEEMQPQRALEAIFALVREGNTYLEQEAPFTKVKTDPRGADAILYNVLELLRWLGAMLDPFIPERALELRRQLGLERPEETYWPRAWGELADGTAVRKGSPLFPRLDPDQQKALLDKWRAARRAAQPEAAAATEQQAPAAQTAGPATATATAAPSTAAAATTAPEPTPEITIEEFKRLDLRIARVLSAERVPKKDRLFKVELDLGPKGKRQVVAGLAQLCPPEELVGKVVVFLSNLKPAKIGGIVSGGMILAVGDEAVVGLLTADREVPLGAAIR